MTKYCSVQSKRLCCRAFCIGSTFSVKVFCPTGDFGLTQLCWTPWSRDSESCQGAFHPSLTNPCLGPSSTSRCTEIYIVGVIHEQKFWIVSYSTYVPTQRGKLCDSIGLGTHMLQIAFLVNPESQLRNDTSKVSA